MRVPFSPLPTAPGKRQKEVLHRYEVLQAFLRKSRAFGAQRQASEKLAYSIGLANLARNAGYSDPQRLSWAMEAQAAADLAQGPVVVSEGAVQATLSINSAGEPELAFEKNGKPLKEAPAAVKKSPGTRSFVRGKHNSPNRPRGCGYRSRSR